MTTINLFLIRHGQSEANVDKSIYVEKSDHTIELTELGQQQANDLGLVLQNQYGAFDNHIVYSPFKRATETAELISKNLSHNSFIEDPLIHEQYIVHSYEEMKTVEDYENPERNAFSPFWYKKGTSESNADTYLRARVFYQDLLLNKYSLIDNSNLFVVSHGMFISMLSAVILGKNVSQINSSRHLKNCEYETHSLRLLLNN